MVQRKRNHDHNILPPGAGAAGSCQYNSGITNGRLCGTAGFEAGVAKCFGMFLNTAIGSGSITFHQKLSAELLKAIVEALQSC